MKLKLKLSTLLLLALALVIAYIASELRLGINKYGWNLGRDKRLGLETHGIDETLRSPASFSSVVEVAVDTDSDSIIDLRTVTIHEGEVYQGIYEASKIDGSGNPRILEMTVGIPPSTLRLLDNNRDGHFDQFSARLSDHANDQVAYTYTDFNLDGRLDRMEIDSADEELKTYVLFEHVWRLTENKNETTEFNQWIREEGAESRKVTFDGSEWVRADDPSNVAVE